MPSFNCSVLVDNLLSSVYHYGIVSSPQYSAEHSAQSKPPPEDHTFRSWRFRFPLLEILIANTSISSARALRVATIVEFKNNYDFDISPDIPLKMRRVRFPKRMTRLLDLRPEVFSLTTDILPLDNAEIRHDPQWEEIWPPGLSRKAVLGWHPYEMPLDYQLGNQDSDDEDWGVWHKQFLREE